MKKTHQNSVRGHLLLAGSLLGLAFAQSAQVSGKVTDGNGNPIAGAQVVFKGTTRGVVSNAEGKFVLEQVKTQDSLLMVSFIGYQGQEININKKGLSNLNISLSDGYDLDDIEIVGFEVRTKEEVKGAKSVISGKDLVSANNNIMDNVQGKIAGVNIVQGGGAGAEPVINIRGAATLQGSQPLYVIDGIIGAPYSSLNPSDIDNMEILKDADAVAMYGSRGANGVISITTKKGKSGSGKFNIEYNGQTSFKDPVAVLDPTITGPRFRDPITGLQKQNNYYSTADGTVYKPIDAFTRWKFSQQHSVSLSGSQDKTNYYFSVSHLEDNGILKYDGFQRQTIKLSVDQQLAKWASTGVDVNFSHRYWKYGNTNRADDINNMDNDWFRGDNLYELFTKENHDKNVYYTVAPWDRLKADDSKEHRYTNLANIYLNLTPVKGLLLRTQVNGQLEFRQAHLYESAKNFNSVEIEKRKGFAKFENVLQGNYSVDQLVNYNFGLVNNRLSIGLIGGLSYYETYLSTQRVSGTEIPDLSVISAGDIGKPTQSAGSTRSWRMFSYFFKASIDWEKKYILSAAIRSDMSSKFPSKNQEGYFPTVSVAWNAKNESFLRNEDLVSQLKVRASFGYSGNQDGILAEASQNGFYYTDPEFNYLGSGLGESYSYKYNPDLKWEQVRSINAGVDFGMLQDRLTMSFDWYNKTTFGAIGQLPLDVSTGFVAMRANIADIRNTGIETAISGVPVLTKHITWRLYANVSANQNKILKINNGTGEIAGSYKIQKEGYEMASTIIKYEEEVEDENGQMITLQKEKYVGGAFPKFEGGLGTTLTLYGVDINMFANFKYGNKVFSRVHDIYREQSDEFLRDGTYLRLKDFTVGYTLPVAISRKAKIEGIRIYVQLTNMLTLKADKWLADPEAQTIRENTYSTGLGYDYGAVPNARSVNVGLSLKI